MNNDPAIVCLCGSTKFKPVFEKAIKEETLAGRIVVAPGFYTHYDGILVEPEVKVALDKLHLAKIDLCDVVLVINPGGYIGESTRNEIEYALSVGKPIRYWFKH
ncbi:hypothetical protein LCGC14_1513530 [marine sediment metagenome]|uniref:DUF4406 domain-containing protein n=1 Tax=marine sediment metagenome TaxID=412755 RepID=A0A0F9JLE8_9ZZZZ